MHRLLIPVFAFAAIAAIAFGALQSAPSHRADAATNLIANGTFDSDVVGWTVSNANFDLTFAGGFGNPAGAARATANTFPAATSSIAQCVAVSPSTSYDASADALVPSTNVPGDTSARFDVVFFSDGACTASISTFSTSTWATNDAWVTKQMTVQAPANAVRALVSLVLTGEFDCDQSKLYFDNVSFTPNDPTATATRVKVRTHTPTRTATPMATSTPTPAPSVVAAPTSPAATVSANGVGAGHISPPNTGSGPASYGVAVTPGQFVPNGC
jgi:hypothetical protein